MSTPHSPLTEHQLICTNCINLTPRVIICPRCTDSLPLFRSFTPNKRVIRVESTCAHSGTQIKEEVVPSIHELQLQLQKYDHLISRLTSSREQITSYISYHKSRIAPIKRLPPELLATIFSFIVHSASATGDDNMFMGQFLPVRLGQVSSAWRRLVWASSDLWTRINISSPDFRPYSSLHRILKRISLSPIPTAYLLDGVNLCLTLSRTRPLYITFDVTHIPETGNKLANALSKHSSRWKEFTVHTANAVMFTFASLGGTFSILEKLTIAGDHSVEGRLSHIFAQAPCISDLSLSLTHLRHFPLPTENIHILELRDVRSVALVDLAVSFHNVVHLTLHFMMKDVGILGPGSLNLPQLMSLNIKGKASIFPLLAALIVPGLEELRIEGVDFTLPLQSTPTPSEPKVIFDGDILQGMNTGKHQYLPHVDLKSLTLRKAKITPTQLLDTLSHLPHLLDLTLTGLSYGGSQITLRTCSSIFFQALVPSPSTIHSPVTPILPPTLESLRIESRDPTLDESIIRAFLSHHLSPSTSSSSHSSLKWVELLFNELTLSSPMVQWLQSTAFEFPVCPPDQRVCNTRGNDIISRSTFQSIFLPNEESILIGNVGFRVRYRVVLGSEGYSADVRSYRVSS